jgi:hypothetical protein
MTESLRILLVNHGLAGEMMGGDGVQIEATAAGLRCRNHQVRVAYSNQPDTTGVDLVHIFNARTDQALAGQLAAARQADLPVVVSPIWISLTQARWGSLAARGVLEKLQQDPTSGERLLKQLIARKLAVNFGGDVLHFDQPGPTATAQLNRIARLLEDVDALLPNSWLELAAFRRDLAWRGTKVEVAHTVWIPGYLAIQIQSPSANSAVCGVRLCFRQAGLNHQRIPQCCCRHFATPICRLCSQVDTIWILIIPNFAERLVEAGCISMAIYHLIYLLRPMQLRRSTCCLAGARPVA